jgi:YidC/Oxa1 family membrane protein insertase
MALSQQPGQMDRMQIIGLVLLGLIFAGYLAYTSYQTQQSATLVAKNKADSLAKAQSTQAAQKQASSAQTSQVASKQTSDTNSVQAVSSGASTNVPSAAAARYGVQFEPFASGVPQFLTVETPLYKSQFSSRGAVVREWQLKKYNSWFGEPVQLVPYSNPKGELGISFTTHEGKEVDTRNLYFTIESSQNVQNGVFQLGEKDSLTITARMMLPNGAGIVKTMTFYGSRYDIDLTVALPSMDNVIANRRYELSWKDGIQYQEENSVNESNSAKAILSQNKNIAELDATDVGNSVQTSGSGTVDFAAVKAQYFMAAIQPKQLTGEPSVYLDGRRINAPEGGAVELYDMMFRLPYSNGGKADRFTVYIGPIDYDIVKPYGLEATVEFGNRFFIRPIAEYMLLPFFNTIHAMIPNYGLAIIVFSIVLRIMMQPLMASQMKSSQKMQVLAPEIEKIRQKYKDDQQKQQQETMALYAEYGINPAGGCLPLVLQLPIFFALSQTLSTITLRQSPFVLWIHDLSVPDVILHLPFKVPLLNVDIFSGMALLTAGIVLVQSMFTVTDPNQKAMVYVMPVMLIFFFSSTPSGLALYYFVFNVLGVAQQVYTTKFAKNKLTLADLKKMPKKEGWLQRKMREAQEIAASQGRSVPGQQPALKNGNGANASAKKKK